MSFPYLIDAPEDGIIEETGWLPVASAATPEEAIATFTRLYMGGPPNEPPTWTEDGLVMICERKEHYRGMVEVREARETRQCGCGHPRVVHNRDGLCTFSSSLSGRCGCTGYSDEGVYEKRIVVARPEHYADDPEGIRFEKCEPDDDGAQEFWRLELVEP